MNLNQLQGHQKICVLGNAASGKTRLAKKISKYLNIQVTHIDSIQFNERMEIKPLEIIREKINEIQNFDQWIIDGYGPLDMLEKRFAVADRILFLDPPLYVNYFWLTYRQIKSVFFPRQELPAGASELRLAHIRKIYRSVWMLHFKMRPELIKMLQRKEYINKVIFL